MAKRPAFGPRNGRNMATRPWHVHSGEQVGLHVLTGGGGVDRLVVRWQGEAMTSQGSAGRTATMSKTIDVTLGSSGHGRNFGDSGFFLPPSASFSSLLLGLVWFVGCHRVAAG
jgi:hypothetical protein